MSQYYEFFCPVKILAGLAALAHLPFELSQLNASRPLLLTDNGVKSANVLAPLTQALNEGGVNIALEYSDVPPDSSFSTVKQVAAKYREYGCDAIIAVGGGSVIDTAKAVNILVTHEADDLMRFSGSHKLTHPLKPLIIVPTTAGTGSEVTSVAVISDDITHTKVAFSSYYLLPNVAVLDPRMTLSLPPKITAMTAMDAMTHAIEAYTGLAHNPLSDAYAVAAIQKISTNLLTVLDNPSDSQARLALAQASTMAGIAFSNSMVGLVHSLGHATGAVAHLPHGQCMNIFLPHVLRYNLGMVGERIGELLLSLAGSEVYAATPMNQRAQKVIASIESLQQQLQQRTGLARSLSETERVSEGDFVAIADKALDDGSIIFNPVEASRQDIMALLKAAY